MQNDVLVQFMIPGLPFGGTGQAGYGNYHGRRCVAVSFAVSWGCRDRVLRHRHEAVLLHSVDAPAAETASGSPTAHLLALVLIHRTFDTFSHERASASVPTWMEPVLASRYPPYSRASPVVIVPYLFCDSMLTAVLSPVSIMHSRQAQVPPARDGQRDPQAVGAQETRRRALVGPPRRPLGARCLPPQVMRRSKCVCTKLCVAVPGAFWS